MNQEFCAWPKTPGLGVKNEMDCCHDETNNCYYIHIHAFNMAGNVRQPKYFMDKGVV